MSYLCSLWQGGGAKFYFSFLFPPPSHGELLEGAGKREGEGGCRVACQWSCTWMVRLPGCYRKEKKRFPEKSPPPPKKKKKESKEKEKERS